MNKRLLLIIGGVALALVAIGGIVFFVTHSQTPPASTPTPTPITSQTAAPLTLTTSVLPATLSASTSASIDVFLNTNGTKIDGFQFIANLDGTSAPVVSDSDATTPGVQIQSAAVDGLNTVTNSVATQGTAQVVRFAMITQAASQPFSSTTPVKVATITFVPGSTGTATLDFNTQNTRANKTGSTDDTLISATPQSLTVAPNLAIMSTPSPTPISTSSATSSATKTKTIASAKTTATPAPVIACDSACLTDNDCSSGLSCINNSCRNATCSTSATCTCGSTTPAVTTASPTPTPKPTATPKVLATPAPTPDPLLASAATSKPVATIAALPKSLPVSGSVEDTIILVMTGLSCMIIAAVFMLKTV